MTPTPRAALLLAAGIPVALLPAIVGGQLWPAWLAYLAAALFLIGLDALLLPGARALAVKVTPPPEVLIGATGSLEVHVTAKDTARPVEVRALLDLDGDLDPVPTWTLTVPPGAEGARTSVPLRPKRRGSPRVQALWLRWTGPLGLVGAIRREPLGRPVAVTPDVNAARTAAIKFFGAKERTVGLKVERYIGDGSEFASLREFVPGYDVRAIDWKATARHRKLLVREYRAERNHQVILAFDTGHLMSAPISPPPVPKLDHAVTSALVLALVGLRAGDRVGVYAFDEQVRSFVEPQSGPKAFMRVRRATADLEYGTGETNFTLGLTELAGRLKRRSLVVVFTDFVDTVTAELMVENIERLAKRHVVIFAAIGDPVLHRIRGEEPTGLRALHGAVVATNLARDREQVIARLRRKGVHCVDAPPEGLGAGLLNRYLDILRREVV